MLSLRHVSFEAAVKSFHVSFEAAAKSVHAPKKTLLFDDGTLFMPQGGESMCQYFLHPSCSHTKIKRIHHHFNHCHDDYAGLGRLEETILSQLNMDGDYIGPQHMGMYD
jgi:hypothetical protein